MTKSLVRDGGAVSNSEPFIPFNRPAVTGREAAYIEEVFSRGKFAGGGYFTCQCNDWLRAHFGTRGVFVTSSCTAALEMAALMCDLKAGDEVIVPSYAFSSTAAAFVRCNASLAFVDVDPGTMNIDPGAVEAAITSKTRVIVVLHYGGVACDMDALLRIAERYGLILIEDAAQAMFANYKGRPCGTFGTFGCISYHESKNLHCGEGGALICNDDRYIGRAEILLEKGTNRSQFFRGEVDKYTWLDAGSSFVLSELNCAFLLAQLEQGERITSNRLELWRAYWDGLEELGETGLLELPLVPTESAHNAHTFWIKPRNLEERSALIAWLKARNIHSVFHYQPLHATPAGRKFGRLAGVDRVTSSHSDRLLRLPLFFGFTEIARVVSAVKAFYEEN